MKGVVYTDDMVKIHHRVHVYHHGQQEQQQKKQPTTNKINKQQTASSNHLLKWMLLTIPTSQARDFNGIRTSSRLCSNIA